MRVRVNNSCSTNGGQQCENNGVLKCVGYC